jgi:hypothetical protein
MRKRSALGSTTELVGKRRSMAYVSVRKLRGIGGKNPFEWRDLRQFGAVSTAAAGFALR